MQNWRSHADTTLEFVKGTNMLVGKMGSGKSSVVDALCFSFFGTFPKLARHDISLEDIRNVRSGNGRVQAELKFSHEGKEYQIRRFFDAKGTGAEIYCEGKLLDKGPVAVTKYVRELLRVDYDLFVRAIYSEQNKIDYLLSIDPRKRKAEIDELLGLDRFENARANASTVAKKLSDLADLFAAECKPERLAELARRIGEYEKKAAKMREEEQALLADEKMLKEEKETLEKQAATLSEKKSKHVSLNDKKNKLAGIIARINAELEGAAETDEKAILEKKAALDLGKRQKSDSEKMQKSHSDFVAAASAELGRLAEAEKNAKKADEEARKAGEKLGALLAGKPLAALETECAACEEGANAARKMISEKKALLDAAKTSKRGLDGAIDDCPVCGQKLGGDVKLHLAAERQKQIASFEHEISEFEKSGKEQVIACEKLKKRIFDSKVVASELERLRGAAGIDIGKIAAEMEECKKKIVIGRAGQEKSAHEARALSDVANKLSSELEKMQRLAANFAQKKKAEEELRQAADAIAALGWDEKAYEKLRAEHMAAGEALAGVIAKREGIAREMLGVTEMLRELNGELSALSSKQKKADYYRNSASDLSAYKNCIAQAQNEVRTVLVEEINTALSHIWPIIYPYSDCSGARMSVGEKDYEIEINADGWKGVDRVASGGERACISLALRISFATVLTPNLSWLILDEPTHNLDAEAVEMLGKALGEKIPTIVEQTFIITHDAGLLDAGIGRVYRLDRDKDKNEDTKVEML